MGGPFTDDGDTDNGGGPGLLDMILSLFGVGNKD